MARIQNLPKRLDFDFYEGDDFAVTINFTSNIDPHDPATRYALDVSDWTFIPTWRPYDESPQTVVWAVDVTEAAYGTVILKVSAAQMNEMRAISPSGIWDLQATYPPEQIKTLAKGYVYLVKDVTYVDV